MLFFLSLLFFSCAPAKYVPEDEFLLNKNKIEIDGKEINKSDLQNYYIQKPNKKWILGIRLNLFFYNLSNVHKNTGFQKWLRKIGEEPEIYDPYLTMQTKEQFKKYCENKGYYFATVADSVSFHKNKRNRRNAKVTYYITPNKPYFVRDIYYIFEDTSIVSIVLRDTIHSLLQKGMLFDKEILQEERVRIEERMKNNGYYRFSKEYIYYDAKATEDSFTIDLTLRIKEFLEGEADRKSKIKYHPCYKINEVTLFPDFKIADSKSEYDNYDTLTYNNLRFLYRGKLKIKPSIISGFNYLNPGAIYKSYDVEKTYQNLSLLGPYKFVNIQFSEPEERETDSSGFYPLNTRIELTRKDVQSYQIEPLLTNSNGDFGFKSNILYQNWNIFRGAEIFNLRLTGGFEVLKDSLYTSTLEFGTETKLEIPRFWLPFRSQQFVKRYGPKTLLVFSLNHRTDKHYVRTYANASFGYTWKGNRFLRHSVYPFELNFVQVDEDRSKTFIDSVIAGTPLEFSFTDHFVGVSRYLVEYNTQEIGKTKDFYFVRVNFESAGNLLYGLSKWTNSPSHEKGYYLLNSPFAQYVKSDFDLRYFRVLDAKKTIVYRLFLGLGYPLGNSTVIPFEKKYFAGGPNSIRAWNAFTLGPGSYIDTVAYQSKYAKYKNIGDIKLELNLEYRFKLFWKVEGAFFADAGNIWDIKSDSTRGNANFSWNRFYKEMAVGVGFGTRFDFSFFLFRLDFGMKVKDPILPEQNRWIPFNHPLKKEDFTIQFGIGYPF